MGRIVEQLRAVGARRTALLLAVVLLVAVLSVAACAGERSEAGIGPRTEAQQDSVTEPLTLTLSAPEICETTQAQGYSGSRQWQNEDGDWVVESYSTGFDDVSETAVTWSVGGGAPPYTLVIDGEARDAGQTYAGPSGTASVSCAMQIGETFIDDNGQGRRYRTEPVVDSGLKTIRATVADGAGATAEASVDVYVILQIPGGGGHRLESGQTYRVHGFLLTVPHEMTLEIGGTETADNGGPWVSLHAVGTPYETWISLATGTGADEHGPRGRRFRHPSKGQVWTDGTLFQTSEEAEAGLERKRIDVPDWVRRIDEQFDELVDSIGRLPRVDRP